MTQIDVAVLNQTFQQAVAHHRAGRLAEAERLYRDILAVRVEPHSLSLLGLIARAAGQGDAALALIDQAIALKPGIAEFHNNRGNVLRDLGRHEEAADALGRALALDPETVVIRVNYGAALLDAKRIEEARAILEAAAQAAPDNGEAHFCLGLARRADKDYVGAVEALRRAVELAPAHAEGWYNLGNALHLDQRDREAVPCFECAIQLKPDYAEAHCNMGMTKRNSAEAIGWYESAIALKPNLAIAHSNLAHTLLLQGDYARGFKEYEWRWRHPETPPRDFAQAEWNGEEMDEGLLLVHAEQGFGDTLQFMRYLALLRPRVRRIAFECQPELLALLEALPGLECIVARGAALPAFDKHVPLMSLPRIFGTTLSTVPASVPYIAVDPTRLARWRERIGGGGGKRVGLVWAGNPKHNNDANRSMRLADLAPLLAVEGIRFYGLQKGERAGDQAPIGAAFTALSDEIEDFVDSAAIVSCLDLLVSVDTSIVHLAGALARPVWVMLPVAPDWRWQIERTDSPWYPALRLFRQPGPAGRTQLVETVAEALRQWARGDA